MRPATEQPRRTDHRTGEARRVRRSRWGAAWLLGTVLGCGGPPAEPAPAPTEPPALAGTVRIDGSSTVAPLCELAAREFEAAHPRVRVPVRVSGTGGGFKKFVKGETDLATASRPILQAERDEAAANGVEFIELPLCFDALTVVVHPENDWVDHLTVAELRTLWGPESAGKPTRWSDVRPGWPESKIELYGPGRDSGTFDYFTEAIHGKAGLGRDDYVAAEDDNRLVRGVAGDRNALGYFGYAYYAAFRDRLRAVPIRGAGAAEAVAPGDEGIRGGKYVPLSRPLFVYASRRAADRPETAAFVDSLLESAPKYAKAKKVVPLSPAAYAVISKRFAERRAGTAFDGKPAVGLSIADLETREPR